jgi:HAD superfamily hydrolase (TIGR01509 family)
VTLVILDIGATLVTGPDRGPWSRLAAQLALAPTQKLALRNALMTTALDSPEQLSSLLSECMGIDRARALRTARGLWAAQSCEAHALDGAEATLWRLAQAGYRLALLSNIWSPYLASVRTHFGGFFDEHVPPELQLFSFREGLAKPAPELFLRLLDRAGAEASEAVMVGDSYYEDIAPAAKLGIATIWVLHRPERERTALAHVISEAEQPPALAVESIVDVEVDAVAAALRRAAERKSARTSREACGCA